MEIDFFGKQPTEVIFYTKTGSIKKVFDTFLKAQFPSRFRKEVRLCKAFPCLQPEEETF